MPEITIESELGALRYQRGKHVKHALSVADLWLYTALSENRIARPLVGRKHAVEMYLRFIDQL